jgi:hypothetical protein
MSKTEKIKIQVGEEVIELTGADKEAFLEQRAKDQAEFEAQRQAREEAELARQAKLDSAVTKLKALGLTEAEAKVVIGIE